MKVNNSFSVEKVIYVSGQNGECPQIRRGEVGHYFFLMQQKKGMDFLRFSKVLLVKIE